MRWWVRVEKIKVHLLSMLRSERGGSPQWMKVLDLRAKLPSRLTIVALGVGTVIPLIAGTGWYVAGATGLQFASVVISGFLTATLVALYFQQTKLLKGQTDLRTQEINREARRNHTEVLQRRIYAWLGTEELPRVIGSVEEIMEETNEQLPNVKSADVVPPGTYNTGYDGPDDFWVVPPELERDRYFDDLLDEHAPELQRRRRRINELYVEFSKYRARFTEEFEGASRSGDGFRVEPDVYLPEWVFEGIVEIERDLEEGWEAELDLIDTSFDRGGEEFEDKNKIRYRDRPREARYKQRAIYAAVPDEGGIEVITDDQAAELAKEAVRATVDEIDVETEPYRYAAEAAARLDAIEEQIRELRADLVEYAGRQVITGECEYLDDAEVDTEDS